MTLRSDGPRRTAIVTAAWACFLQFGYGKTSLGDVARRAGLARPQIYQYFAGKEDLFASVITAIMEKNFQEARVVLSRDLDRRARLMAVLDAWLLQPLENLAGSPQGEELFEQALHLTPEVHAAYAALTRELLVAVIPDAAAVEVFRLALAGLKSDHPSIDTLRARVAVLAERFVI